jgi:MYXO-CTERM domain-containing protein
MRRLAISAACAAALLATPAAALGDAPAKDQYAPPPVSATGSGHGPGGTPGSGPSGSVGGSGGGSASPVVPILIGGLGVLGAGGLIAYRRRRNAERQRA